MFDPMIRSFVVVNDCPRGMVCVEKPLVDPLISTLSDINDCPKGQVGGQTHVFDPMHGALIDVKEENIRCRKHVINLCL